MLTRARWTAVLCSCGSPRHQEASGASMGAGVFCQTRELLRETQSIGHGGPDSSAEDSGSHVCISTVLYIPEGPGHIIRLYPISLLAGLEAGAYQTDQSYSDSSASLVSPNSVLLAKRDRKSQLSDEFRQSEARLHSFLVSSDPNCGIYFTPVVEKMGSSAPRELC